MHLCINLQAHLLDAPGWSPADRNNGEDMSRLLLISKQQCSLRNFRMSIIIRLKNKNSIYWSMYLSNSIDTSTRLPPHLPIYHDLSFHRDATVMHCYAPGFQADRSGLLHVGRTATCPGLRPIPKPWPRPRRRSGGVGPTDARRAGSHERWKDSKKMWRKYGMNIWKWIYGMSIRNECTEYGSLTPPMGPHYVDVCQSKSPETSVKSSESSHANLLEVPSGQSLQVAVWRNLLEPRPRGAPAQEMSGETRTRAQRFQRICCYGTVRML